MTDKALPIVVLISGSGSNLQALIDAIDTQPINAEICAVISNREHALGLDRAQKAGIDTHFIDHTRYADRAEFDQALMQLIDSYQPGLIVLAGFMRILTDEFVNHYNGRMLNIHPSLLPDYKGLNTHQRVLDDEQTTHGASVHFVSNELDGGPVIIQASVPVYTDDTPETLAARVLEKEHQIYPMAVKWFADNRIQLQGQKVFLDGAPLEQPVSM